MDRPRHGEVQAKLHVHWRLAEPTQTPEEHARLKRARTLACELVGADATSKPAVHPMRWAGTLHRKNPDAPKLARIVEENADAEIILEDALAELEGAGASSAATSRPSSADPSRRRRLMTCADAVCRLACAERIGERRAGMGRLEPHRHGVLARQRRQRGRVPGLRRVLAQEQAKYDAEATRARWEHYRNLAADRLGIGTLVYEARKAEPDFLKRKPKAGAAAAGGGGRRPRAWPSDDWEAKLAAAIEEMNARYFVAGLGGRGVIASLVHDDAMERERLVFSREQDIRLLYKHRHYVVAISQKGNEIWKDLGAAWLEDWRRRSYDRIALIPNGPAPPGVLQPLARLRGASPKAGDWPLLRQHMLEVVCAGDQSALRLPDRLVRLLRPAPRAAGRGRGRAARARRAPARAPSRRCCSGSSATTPCTSPTPGTWSATSTPTSPTRCSCSSTRRSGPATSRARARSRRWSPSPRIMIEPKGIDPFMMPNRLKILMASNADWVVPASADERRYFVLDVSNARRGDHAYFEALHAALEGGELAAFLHHLLTHRPGRLQHPRRSAHRRAQQAEADRRRQRHPVLGRLPDGKGHIIGTGGTEKWPEDITTQVLHAVYLEHARLHGERHPAIDARMAERLEELCAGCTFKRVRLTAQAGTAAMGTQARHTGQPPGGV